MHKLTRRSFLAALPLSAAGCTSLLTEDRINRLSEAAAFNGTYLRLTNHPDDKPRFVLVREDLRRQLNAGIFDPIEFAATLRALNIPELSSTTSILVLTTIIILTDSQGNSINLNTATKVKSALSGIVLGMDTAMALLPSE